MGFETSLLSSMRGVETRLREFAELVKQGPFDGIEG
jgi:hypothetical protein